MKKHPIALFALLAFILSVAYSEPATNESKSESISIEQRLNTAIKQRSEAMAGSTAGRVKATHEIIELFLPEAADELSNRNGISSKAATREIRKRMQQAASKAETDYVKEFGYGSIVLDLRSAAMLEVLREISNQTQTTEVKP